MRFVIDDTSWVDAPLDPPALEAGLDDLADRLDVAFARHEVAGYHESLWDAKVCPGQSLADLLWSASSQVDPDVRRRLGLLLERIKGNAFGDDGLRTFSVDVGGTTFLAPSVVYAAQAVATRAAVACLTPSCSGRRSRVKVALVDAEGVADVHFVPNEPAHVEFFRDAFEVENADDKDFGALAPSAFPQLRFTERAIGGLRDLSKPFRDRRRELVGVFSTLSDHGHDIFRTSKEKEIEERFRARGLSASTETRETLADAKCRRARLAEFLGRELLFDWHVKLEPHIDRVHLHPPVDASVGAVIVGVIHEHLPLPGDH